MRLRDWDSSRKLVQHDGEQGSETAAGEPAPSAHPQRSANPSRRPILCCGKPDRAGAEHQGCYKLSARAEIRLGILRHEKGASQRIS